jgi:hypothetical protein
MQASTSFVALKDFAAAQFHPLVGRSITFLRPPYDSESPSGYAQLQLIQVTENQRTARAREADPSSYPAHFRTPFSLLFTLDLTAQPPLALDLHRLQQPGLEECDLLLTRVIVPGRDPAGGSIAFYEAVFA